MRTTMLKVTDSQPPAARAVPQQAPRTGRRWPPWLLSRRMRAQVATSHAHSEAAQAHFDRVSPGTADLASDEYQALRAEIVARIQKQQDIMNFAILVVTALLSYAGLARLNSSAISRTLAALGAPASLALSIFALMTLDHEMNIAHATRYVYEYLGPAWIKAADADDRYALQWNVARRSWQQPPGLSLVLPTTMAAAKYYAITLLNVLLVLTSWVELALHAKLFTNLSWILLFLATGLLALTLNASRYTSRIWLGMKRDNERYPPI